MNADFQIFVGPLRSEIMQFQHLEENKTIDEFVDALKIFINNCLKLELIEERESVKI